MTRQQQARPRPPAAEELPEDPVDTDDARFDHAIDRAEALLSSVFPVDSGDILELATAWIELARVINERQRDWS